MSKVLIALSLAIITTVVACGGGDGGGSRMTVEEYAAACEGLDNRLDLESFDDVAAGLDAMEDAVAEVKRWNPPKELQEFHEARVESLDAVVDGLKDTGFFQLLLDLEKAVEGEDEAELLRLMGEMSELEDAISDLEDLIEESEDEMERTQEDLSPATREILAGADCLGTT